MPRRNKSLEFADLHCGIGSLRLAFEQIGGECVWSRTSDAEAARCHAENFGDIRSADDIPAHDILVVNLDECRAVAKKQSARRQYDLILDVVCLRRPLACLLAGRTDTARATSSPALIDDLVRVGYFVHRATLDARLFGLPHARLTEFLVAFDRETGFRFPAGAGKAVGIERLLDPAPAGRYYISEANREKLVVRRGRSLANGNKWRLGFVAEGCANALRDAPDSPYGNILVESDGRWRVLTEREAARLQGIPDSVVLHPDGRTAYKQVARCAPVPVAAAVAERIVAELRPGRAACKTCHRDEVAWNSPRNRDYRGSRRGGRSGTSDGSASPLHWYGSLNSFAKRIMTLLPKHKSYCEAFGGSAAILMAKPPSTIETFADADGNLVNFWRVLREPPLRARLIEMVEMTPFSRTVFRDCLSDQGDGADPVKRAWSFVVACNQARNGRGVNESDWANNRHDGRNASTWARLPKRLAEIGQRLKRVQVENLPFEDTLRRYDSPNTLFLLDPPYLPETRASGDRYTHEFTRDDHIRLLRITTRGLKAMVAICAYRNELYDRALVGWHRTDFKNRSYAGPRTPGRKLPLRVLSVFTNYEPPTR
jgi:DNA adenine methylase